MGWAAQRDGNPALHTYYGAGDPRRRGPTAARQRGRVSTGLSRLEAVAAVPPATTTEPTDGFCFQPRRAGAPVDRTVSRRGRRRAGGHAAGRAPALVPSLGAPLPPGPSG